MALASLNSKQQLTSIVNASILMFVHNATINPIISEMNPPQIELIYFVLGSSSGFCIPGYHPWSTTLHIAIDLNTLEYNDEITCSEWQVARRSLGFVELPEDYLVNLVKLSNDTDFLAINNDMLYEAPICDAGNQLLEYYVDGHHESLRCYAQSSIDGGQILLKPQKEDDDPVVFETGIKGTSDIVAIKVEPYYRIRKEDYRARDFVDKQTWHSAKGDNTLHSYYCLKGSSDAKEFEWFIDYIIDNSISEQLCGERYDICTLDGWKYWIKKKDSSQCIMINRVKENR